MKTLRMDDANGVIDHGDFNLWSSCIEYHWYGQVHKVPDYVGMLRLAGYEQGKRLAIQLPTPKEFPRV